MATPNYLHKFSDDARKSSKDPSQAPNAISAGALDKNFRACLPLETTGNNEPYKVIADENGWRLDGTLVFDVCENGQPRKFVFFARKIGSDG
jgi:hypothetical protein